MVELAAPHMFLRLFLLLLSPALWTTTNALSVTRRKCFVAGLDGERSPAANRALLVDHFTNAELRVERVELFDDGRNYGFVTLEDDASVARAIALPPTPGLFAQIKLARTPVARSASRTLQSSTLFASSADLGNGEDSENADVPAQAASVIVEGVRDPENVGAMMRLMASFGVLELTHVHGDTGPAPAWDDPHRARKLAKLAKGGDAHVSRALWPRRRLLEHLASDERDPVIALETASSATPLTELAFPERCVLLVGAEGRGLDARVARALRPERGDAFAIIPMTGPKYSLNVATALGIALYEYRRQWPATRAVPLGSFGEQQENAQVRR